MRRFVDRGVVTGMLALLLTLAGGAAALAAGSPAASPEGAASASAVPEPAAPSLAADGVSAAGTRALAVPGIPFRFRADAFTLRDLGLTDRPFSGSGVVPREDNGIHDEEGVRMRRIRGKLYDFPRGQASYGIDNLNSYRLTGDQFYLDRALLQANRLIAYHDEGGEAWYYPNYPSKYRHGRPGEFIQAPYYSALPQGRILLFFARLAEMTGQEKWRAAADHTFLAFLRRGPTSGPYILNVDSAGYYWLQEWPWAGMQPDCTLNGHISSLYGLFEYAMVTGDARAKALFRGAVTTVKRYLPQFRRDGWVSCYCLAHRSTNANYHAMHVGQLLGIYKMTGAPLFARAADTFSNDYPKPNVEGRLLVQPGRYTAVRVDETGRVLARRQVRITRTTSWPASLRQRLWRRSPIHLRVASGALAGWWLPEHAGSVHLVGVAARHGYAPSRTLRISAGESCVALLFNEKSSVTARARVDTTNDVRLKVDRRAVINGHDRVRVSGGDLDGYWLKLRRGLRLY
jgi:hypothetical protein